MTWGPELRRQRYQNRMNAIAAIKVARGCEWILDDGSVCGWRDDPCGLDFDHRDPTAKRFPVTTGCLRSWWVVQAEIDKCDVLCAVHHRIKTWRDGDAQMWRGLVPVADSQLSLFEEPAA